MPGEARSADDVSVLLQAWSEGDAQALDKLLPLVYEELRGLARRYMQGERSGHSLQATALVNEAYLRLIGYNRIQWQNRSHFFAVSAQVMRRILVEHARRRNLKRGAGFTRVLLDETAVLRGDQDADVIALDDALSALARLDPRKVQIIEMRFFSGLGVEEIAEVLNLSAITIKRDWRAARAWLYRELNANAHDPGTLPPN